MERILWWRPLAARGLLAGVLASGCSGLAAAPGPVHYGVPGGTLVIDTARQTVHIRTTGANGHTCRVDGQQIGPQRVAADGGCHFQLGRTADGQGLRVQVPADAQAACRAGCGQRAGFDGDYRRMPARCLAPARAQTLAEAGALAGQSNRAWTTLATTHAACAGFMAFAEDWEWRNQRAAAAYQRGRLADCARLSASVLAGGRSFTLPGEAEPFSATPSDADTARPLLQAARAQLALCAAGDAAGRAPVSPAPRPDPAPPTSSR